MSLSDFQSCWFGLQVQNAFAPVLLSQNSTQKILGSYVLAEQTSNIIRTLILHSFRTAAYVAAKISTKRKYLENSKFVRDDCEQIVIQSYDRIADLTQEGALRVLENTLKLMTNFESLPENDEC